MLHRDARVVGVQDALQHDRQLGALAQERQIRPGHRGVRELPRPLADRGLHVLLGRHLQEALEDGVGEVVAVALPPQERQEPLAQIGRAPAEQPRVQRHHDRRVPRTLGALPRSCAPAHGPAASRADTSAPARPPPRRSPQPCATPRRTPPAAPPPGRRRARPPAPLRGAQASARRSAPAAPAPAAPSPGQSAQASARTHRAASAAGCATSQTPRGWRASYPPAPPRRDVPGGPACEQRVRIGLELAPIQGARGPLPRHPAQVDLVLVVGVGDGVAHGCRGARPGNSNAP